MNTKQHKEAISKAFVENLKRARKRKAWTQDEASERLGIGRPTYASYEEGRAQPDFCLLLKMCDVFGIEDLKGFIGGGKVSRTPAQVIELTNNFKAASKTINHD